MIFGQLAKMGFWYFVIAPFLIWGAGLVLWVGFFFPLTESLKVQREGGYNFIQAARFVRTLGVGRTIHYRWEIFFSTLGGIPLTDAYWMGLRLSRESLPSALHVLVLFAGSWLFGVFMFAKGNNIMSDPSGSSPIGSAKYILGGYQNPFKKEENAKIRAAVKLVNEKIFESKTF